MTMNHVEPCSTPTRVSRRPGPLLISFSGIDGAGKSTQINAIRSRLREAGFRVRLITFWDDVAGFGRAREFLTHTLFKSEKGMGVPGRPVQRRDKDVRGWYMTAARFVLYFLDALRLSAVVAKASAGTDVDVVLFDRYLYDELANLELGSRLSRAYVRLLLKFVPRPDIAFVLDADPVRARERKPEYRLDFIRTNRASYLALSSVAGGITVIPPLNAEEVTHRLLVEISRKLPQVPEAGLSGELLSSR